MNFVAMALLTRDRVEKTRRAVEPLKQPDKFDLFWIDGSKTLEGKNALTGEGMKNSYGGVVGGADAAIVFALTEMLKGDYTHVGLCENDVLLDSDWFDPTFALFDRGCQDGLEVGAVSARCYEDRVLLTREGYAVVHNLGSGQILLTRQAARIVLDSYRTGLTADNRAVFSQLSGIDIAAFWAFRGSLHPVTGDWAWNAVLAAHGLASLALTPSKAQMMEDIAAQGLTLAEGPVEARRDEEAWQRFVERTRDIREGKLVLPGGGPILHDPESGAHTVFPHQTPLLGGTYSSGWRLKWSQGFGPFSYRASGLPADMRVPVYGPCQILVGGSQTGGQVHIQDLDNGYESKPDLMPESSGNVLRILVPTGGYRTIALTALTPGSVFYGIETREPQPLRTDVRFDYSSLPPVEDQK